MDKAYEIAKITRLYEGEIVSGKLAESTDDIPTSYESITPAWLTAIVCNNAPGSRVLSYSLGPKDNGSSGRRRIFLKYNDAGQTTNLPSSIFAKASQELSHRISYRLHGGLHAEENFYNVVRPVLNIEAPTSYFAKADENTCNSILLLSDFGSDVEFCDEHTVISKDDAMEMASLLAEMHGSFYQNDKLAALRKYFYTWPERWSCMEKNLEFVTYCNSGFLRAESVIPPRLFKRFDEVMPRTKDSVDAHLGLPQTFCHGDTHLSNWYRAKNGGMGLLDYQGSSLGHWSRDFIYAMCTALTIENRRAWLDDLLKHYLRKLEDKGLERIEFDNAFLLCRQQSLSALAFWTVTYCPSPDLPQDMQPPDRSLAFIERLTTAVCDLEALDSFSC